MTRDSFIKKKGGEKKKEENGEGGYVYIFTQFPGMDGDERKKKEKVETELI